ncbi:hypothetical protein BDV11DRAFT_182503 [Aspergillus similis]
MSSFYVLHCRIPPFRLVYILSFSRQPIKVMLFRCMYSDLALSNLRVGLIGHGGPFLAVTLFFLFLLFYDPSCMFYTGSFSRLPTKKSDTPLIPGCGLLFPGCLFYFSS